MLGFANLHDDAWITRREIAARLGYASVSAAERALARRGLSLPKAMLGRGLVRAAVVKKWAALIGADLAAAASPGSGQAEVQRTATDAAAVFSSRSAGVARRAGGRREDRGSAVIEAAAVFARIKSL